MKDDLGLMYRVEYSTFEWVDKPEFDRLCEGENWSANWDQGPLKDGFGDGYGEPYRPYRSIFGILTGGRRIRTNTKNDKELKV